MNHKRNILFPVMMLLMLGSIWGTQSAQAASVPKIPVVTQDFDSRNVLGTKQNQKKSLEIRKKYKKHIFIDDSASLMLLGDLDDYDVTYKSSNSSVLKVNTISATTCDYIGVSAGTATITARIRSKSGLFFMNKTTIVKTKITVSPWAASVKFRCAKYKITAGKSKQIRTTIRPSISKEKPVLESLNPSIATVSQKGVVRAKSAGTTYIIASIHNGIQTRCKIIVKQRHK